MEFEQLRQLQAVAQCGTVSRAAEILHLSQPALSRSLQRLERELGLPLFERTKNSLVLNEAGRLALEHAEGILRAERHLVDALSGLARDQRTLRIATCAPAPLWRLAALVTEWSPDALVSPETLDPKLVERRLLDQSVDLAILPHPLHVPGVLSVPFMTERLYLSVPAGHALAARESVRLADVDGETFLLYAGIGFWRDVCRRAMPRAHFVTQDDFVVFDQMARSSSLLSFATNVSLGERAAAGRALVPVEDPEAHATFYAVLFDDADSRWRPLADLMRQRS